ncbi:MAG TPA: class I SAM-dependent methyltransferase [Gaiellaceae bacterium]|nr:class I SAM-dependent methyltransferase [Gaiellaceae bacterium]
MDIYAPFAEIYEEWSAPMTEDVPFYVELAREADGPVVELAVGTGRVAVAVAEAIGRRVIGIDRSPAMLAKARKAADAARVDLELREADMRELSLDEPAALVYCPYRSLLHLPTWADRRTVFERVAASLEPGGRFAWNAFVFDPHIAVRMDGVARPHLDSETLWEYVAHHPEDNRIDITAYTGEPGLNPRNLQLWWLTRSEWDGLIDVSGLEVEALYGWFDKRPFDDESREFVWVARKPE